MNSIVVNDKHLDNIDLFIFDKDGTLMDVHQYWCGMVKLRAKYLVDAYIIDNNNKAIIQDQLMDAMGIDLETNKIKPQGPVGIEPRSIVIEVAHKTLLKYSNSITKEDISNAFKHVDNLSVKRINELLIPLPGVPDFLIMLKKNGIKMALATTDITARAKLALSSLKIIQFFDVIAGADLVKNAKPASDLVNFITNKLSVENEHSVVVGDSMSDLKMAKNSNSKFIGVKTGLYNDDFLRESVFLAETLNNIKVQK